MIKMAVVHVAGPRMTPEYKFAVETSPGGLEAFQSKVNERTEAEMAELDRLIAEGYEKFDAQKFSFSDGEAIIYLLRKPNPPEYVIEKEWADRPTGSPQEWEPVGAPYTSYKDALTAMQALAKGFYTYRIRSVDNG